MDAEVRIRHALALQDKRDKIYQLWRSYVNAKSSVHLYKESSNDMMTQQMIERVEDDVVRFDALLEDAIDDYLDSGGTVDAVG